MRAPHYGVLQFSVLCEIIAGGSIVRLIPRIISRNSGLTTSVEIDTANNADAAGHSACCCLAGRFEHDQRILPSVDIHVTVGSQNLRRCR